MPSLTETAKAILMKEESYPSVSPMDAGHPDRDAKKSNPNASTLKAGSKSVDSVMANPGAPGPEEFHKKEDLGPALVKHGDVPPSAKASNPVKKDTSKSSKASVAAEPTKKSKSEMMEEDVEQDETVEVVNEQEELEEDFEISEELEAFIDEMIEEGYNEDEIAAAIEENFEFVTEEEEVPAYENYEVDMREHVDALLAGEELSEEFREKATTIFEAAVKAKVVEEIEVMERAFSETLEEEIENFKQELASNVDDYLNYVVEQWVSDNEIAIEAGLRTELTEEFISGLKNLFAENYIDIPEDKVNVIEEMSAKIDEMESKLNEEIERNVVLNKMLSESKKSETISALTEGLTATQTEKLKSLAESIEFTDADDFTAKVKTLRENYFPSGVPSGDNVLDNNYLDTDGKSMISESLQGPMAAYVKTLGRTLPKQ